MKRVIAVVISIVAALAIGCGAAVPAAQKSPAADTDKERFERAKKETEAQAARDAAAEAKALKGKRLD